MGIMEEKKETTMCCYNRVCTGVIVGNKGIS